MLYFQLFMLFRMIDEVFYSQLFLKSRQNTYFIPIIEM